MDDLKKESQDKKIDESWKETVDKEKIQPELKKDTSKEEHLPHEDEHRADFSLFVSSLAMQAFVYLGLMPDPVSQKTYKDIAHAKYMIDTIEMLKDKTRNNLTKEENSSLDEVLYTLRMKFIEQSKP